MIIKRKNAGALAPKSDEKASGKAQAERTKPKEPELVWNEETVEAGQAPERRDEERRSDRRRGWRRVEDKHLISKAHEEAIAIRENACDEGFKQGLSEAAGTVEELRAAIDKLMSAREDALASVADEISQLAVEVAARVIKTEVACDNTLVAGIVRDTIQKAGRRSKSILVKVNPGDVATVKEDLRDNPISNMEAELVVMEDPGVDSGSCIIETNSGLIDASFTTQLGILRQLFGITGNTGMIDGAT